MQVSEAKELFRQLTEFFFPDSNVIFANQSRVAKPEIPLVTLLVGNVKRPQTPNNAVVGGVLVGHYLSTMTITVDLFTNGRPIRDRAGQVLAYENTAMDEILAYADFLNSPRCVLWCHAYNVSILTQEEAQDLTGVVNDNNYEYRARLEVLYSFTQETDPRVGDLGFFQTAEPEGRF